MKNAIELKSVSKRFPGFEIKNMTFSLPSGCILGLIGKNGAGKSTTIHLIMNMLRKDQGCIKVLGKNNEEHFEQVKEDIGVVLDEPGFPEFITIDKVNKIMRNIYRNWEEDRYYELVKQLELPREKKQFKDYSKGMKMKLAIAVALSHQAKLLILDEPTSGLDPVVRDQLLDIFYEFTRKEGHSILISSHIVGDLERLCDYIAYIDDGRLKIFEEKDQLLQQYGLLKCSIEELQELDECAIKGIRKYTYGVEALVDKRRIPQGYQTDIVTLEEILVFLAKGQRGVRI